MTTYTHPSNMPYPGPGPARASGVGIAALIVGIIALLLSFTGCASWLGAILGVVGLILGIVGLSGARKDPTLKRGLPMGGVITSTLAILIGGVVTIVMVVKGPELAQWGIKKGATEEARQIEATARGNNVDDATITAARAKLDAVINAVPADYQQLERATKDIERAMAEFEQTLTNPPSQGGIPGRSVDGGMDDNPLSTRPAGQ